MSGSAARHLTRRAFGAPSPGPPTRIAHFGLGSFHRAHQAWFTAHAGDGDEWGICAFTGRRSAIADSLRPQEGLYTLIERSAVGDRFEVMTNLVEVYEGSDCAAIVDVLSRPEVVVVTSTVTESGYRIGLDGSPHFDDAKLARDIETLRELTSHDRLDSLTIGTIPGRMLLGLEARRRANVGPIAFVPCDNVPNNGWVLERGLTQLTEPFASWVISGDFPAGRPQWEQAGALFVDDIEPYERRKLWLLNGAHSILAYLGLEAGHVTVAQAVGDPRCRSAVQSFWSSAAHHLHELELEVYCGQLVERFENSRIEYQLEQIASDSLMKLRTRIVPVIVAEFLAGRDCPAGAEAVAAWIRQVHARGSFPDDESLTVDSIVGGPHSAVVELIRLVDPHLVGLGAFVDRVERMVNEGVLIGETTQT